jgi:uncharacterized membrane protein YeaQ/YmgE (transglycosylase-associated protein family)
MSTFVWVVSGALVGWIAYQFLNMSVGRGQVISLVIGAMGAVLGGKLVAPVFIAASEVPGAFSAPTLLIATLVAAGLLLIGNFIYEKWQV